MESVRTERNVVTQELIENLPAPVKRYLTYTGIIGKPLPDNIRLKQIGRIRLSAEQPWMTFDAKQYYTVNPPSFVWEGSVRKGGLPWIRARDLYQSGKGKMQIKLAGVIPIANATGKEMDESAMMRYLSEMIWFPAAFLRNNVSFRHIGDNSSDVTFVDNGKSVTATIYFDAQGRVKDFVAQRYREVKSNYELSTWSTPVTEYGEFEGLKVPLKGKAVWRLSQGDFEYIDVTLADLEYNAGKPY